MLDIKTTSSQTASIIIPSPTLSVNQNPAAQNFTQIKDYIFDSKSILGRGSMSVVYKGVDLRTNEVVGIKKISKRALNSDYLINSLTNEIDIQTKIRHSNIVSLKDVIRSTNNIYLVLEYCNFGNLRDYLKARGKLTESEIRNILSQIIKGMDGLLQNNVLHRDIKPENILVHSERGVLTYKICDFGFSKKLTEKNQLSQSSIGSPQYMDFQRLSSEEYSSKSDVFSLGIITYEMLFGYPPWSASNWHELKCAMVSKPLQFPDAKFSKDVEDFLKKTLAIWETDRASWEDVLAHSFIKRTL